ncbi:MAG: 16S rRNA (guanine(966)-N(2))-methyltransferase RsmD [Solirubrobacteraceae bacterium]
MRVIAGAQRGAKLRAPYGERTRPTSDRVREAVFSMLADVRGERVLDLFAGSGALAIEALSRGAASATLVDSSTAAIKAITGNLKALGMQAEVQRRDAISFLAAARKAGRQYDLVFVDPPYRLAGVVGRELSIALGPLLAPDGRVVTESDRRAPLELELPLMRERRYGDTLIRIHEPR